MDNFNESVMVALLPTTSEWCKIDLPHLTIVYVGEIWELKPSIQNDLAKLAISMAQVIPELTLDVLAVDILGDVDLVDVILLRPIQDLLTLRSVFEEWDGSEHKKFLPHATIGPAGSRPDKLPNTITFDRIVVSWGETYLTYNLQEETAL